MHEFFHQQYLWKLLGESGVMLPYDDVRREWTSFCKYSIFARHTCNHPGVDRISSRSCICNSHLDYASGNSNTIFLSTPGWFMQLPSIHWHKTSQMWKWLGRFQCLIIQHVWTESTDEQFFSTRKTKTQLRNWTQLGQTRIFLHSQNCWASDFPNNTTTVSTNFLLMLRRTWGKCIKPSVMGMTWF